MLSAAEQDFVANHAYVPEHVPGYVTAISSAEPHLGGEYLSYLGARSLVFVGYPLGAAFDAAAMARALKAAISRFGSESVAIVAPSVSTLGAACRSGERDRYYRLDLSTHRTGKNVQAMIRRASREVRVESGGPIGEEHALLIADFLGSHELDDETRHIFRKIPAYVTSMATARIFSARDPGGRLAAFDVAEFGAVNYAFYLFNFRSRTCYVPGASDLLLDEMIRTARGRQQRYLNLGLGINAGITYFKQKWGASPFLDYEYCRYRPRRPTVFDALVRKP